MKATVAEEQSVEIPLNDTVNALEASYRHTVIP